MSNRQHMDALMGDLAANRVTQFSPSPYETGQYLRVSGRGTAAGRQVDYLLGSQRDDGLWGAPGFELVPTLGAVAGLGSGRKAASLPRAREAVARACGKLWELALSERGLPPLPDTVASELIMPSLVETTGEVLRRHCPAGDPDSEIARSFPNPPRARPEFYRKLKDQISSGSPIPMKIWHSLEVFHPFPAGFARMVSPADDGAVACSPAATAAWLSAADPDPGCRSLAYLEEAETRYGGAIPMGSSMPYFELLWVLNLALKYFPDVPVPDTLAGELSAAFGAAGIGGGPGLPPDGDDTAYAMLAAEKMGQTTDAAVLLQFWEDDHFLSYSAEQTPSETTNAHALEYLSHLRERRGLDTYGRVEDACAAWLVAQQSADGCWHDKWNISPYYATAACVEALLGGRPTARPQLDAIGRARRWLLETQSSDGGWGMFGASREETAYAVMALDCLASGPLDGPDEAAARSVASARDFLARPAGEKPSLWMGKDLYTPYRIVSAVELCGREVAARY